MFCKTLKEGSISKAKDIGCILGDMKGKIKTPTISGHSYFLKIVEGHRRFT